jgi:phage shock protein PspC (stress-responsive transcriptional regulator)
MARALFTVGASLLAIVAAHSTYIYLTHRYREQARSHRFNATLYACGELATAIIGPRLNHFHQDVNHMQVEGFFEWLGQALGSVIRFIVDALSGLFNLLSHAGSNFVEGLSRTLGMDASIISIIALILGLMLLWSAIRAFMNASIIMGIIWLVLGLWLLSWIIH